MNIKKRKYTLEKAIADTSRIQGKLILDEDQVLAINELLVELKAYRKISKKIHSATKDVETVIMNSLEEEIIQFKSSFNNPTGPYAVQQEYQMKFY